MEGANRVTRVAALALIAGAAGMDLWLSSPHWRHLPVTALGIFIGCALLARVQPPIAAWVPTFTAFIAPAVVLLVFGRVHPAFLGLWIWAVLGVIAGSTGSTTWSLPGPWRFPIAAWALILGCTWPIVALRELDFTPALIDRSVPHAVEGLWPAIIISGVCGSVAVAGAGLLWFDWLHSRYAGRPERLRHEVVVPLVASGVVAMTVGAYQGLVDLSWMSGSVWPAIGRAAGTLFDANAFGTAAALSGPLAVALVWQARSASRVTAASFLFALSWVAVWSSASRTALLAAIVASGGLAWAVRPAWIRPRTVVAASVAFVALAAAVIATGLLPLSGPLGRISAMFPERSLRGAAHVAAALWSRDMYGTASTQMIEDFPWFGIGPGFFHAFVLDYSRMLGRLVPPDNAQNWFRHQVAELGVVGSLPWIAWTIMIVWFVVRIPVEKTRRTEALVARGCLLALTAASLLGMPTQYPGLTLMFWVLTFVTLDSGAAKPGANRSFQHSAAAGWMAVLLVVAAYDAGTLVQARGDLRPPYRAARFGLDYTYGFDFTDPNRAWTTAHAVTVPRSTQKWMQLTYWVEHPDADRNRVGVQIWRDGERIVSRRMSRGIPVTEYVEVPGNGKRFVLEVKVDRTFPVNGTPRGLAMKWTFVQNAPGR